MTFVYQLCATVSKSGVAMFIPPHSVDHARQLLCKSSGYDIMITNPIVSAESICEMITVTPPLRLISWSKKVLCYLGSTFIRRAQFINDHRSENDHRSGIKCHRLLSYIITSMPAMDLIKTELVITSHQLLDILSHEA